uniref:Si:ch211-214j24.10 n=1 Tax=Cynoglossus semilaevis TaxID=244447 RepID=A0A3P8WS24_CYNSE
MHIKTGTWEASNTVCESDSLCDPAVLVSAASSEPHIRNRRLSPGSGNCGGGGGGCISGGDQHPRQLSPEGDLIAPGPTNAYGFRREKERKGQQHKGRSLRREDQKVVSRANERRHKANQKQRWVEDSLSLLKPPPAFPVQDSPAKLQPAVSYASKVKAGAQGGALEEERPLIGVLLQNQWGLSFISEARPITESHDLQMDITFTGEAAKGSPDVPVDESDGKLLLSCRHLVEAMNYHNKGEAWQIIWYKDSPENPA